MSWCTQPHQATPSKTSVSDRVLDGGAKELLRLVQRGHVGTALIFVQPEALEFPRPSARVQQHLSRSLHRGLGIKTPAGGCDEQQLAPACTSTEAWMTALVELVARRSRHGHERLHARSAYEMGGVHGKGEDDDKYACIGRCRRARHRARPEAGEKRHD